MGSPRVLVVDDDPELAMMVRDVLKKAGFDCWIAGPDNAEALFSAKSFDLLVTDKNMPGISGYELIKRLRTRTPSLPVVLMTAYPEPSLEAGAIQGYLAKPFPKLRHVVDTVQRTLEMAKSLAEAKLKFRKLAPAA